jgi:hypothetical protein
MFDDEQCLLEHFHGLVGSGFRLLFDSCYRDSEGIVKLLRNCVECLPSRTKRRPLQYGLDLKRRQQEPTDYD